MKKLLAVLLIALVAGSMIFAQGGEEASTTSSGLMTIDMLFPGTFTEAGKLPDDWAGYQIIKDELGIDLQLDMLPSSSQDQDMLVRSMAAADQLPDFFVCSREVWTDLVKNQQVLDVTDYYDDMPHRSAVMFDDAAKKYVTASDGRIYGFATPAGVSGNEGLLVRKDWLDNLGLDIPTTLDELYDVLYAFTYNDPDGNGKDDTFGYGAFVEENVTYEIYPGRRFEPLMGAFGVEGTWDMHADSFGLMVHKPEYYDWMVFFKKCIDTGVIDPNWQSYKKDDFRAAWKQGKFGVFREQNAAYAMESNYAPFDSNFPDGGFVIIDAPIGPNGKQSVGPLVKNMRIFVINADVSPEKAAKIVELFDWMSYGEGYMLCGYGEEGKNYVLDENGLPIDTDPVTGEDLVEYGYNKTEGKPYIQLLNCAFNYSDPTELALTFPAYITKVSHKYMSSGDAAIEMQAKTWTVTNGQNSMPIPKSIDVTTYYQQGIAEFLNGNRALTPENWKAFIDQFDKIGGLEWEQEGKAFAEANGYLL